jgi:hypothetical protein
MLGLTECLGWIKVQHAGKIAVLRRALERCKAADITVVIAAGNDASRTLDTTVPQEFGTDDAFSIITVGGVDKEGKHYKDTTNSRKDAGGKVDLYTDAIDVKVAVYNKDDNSFTETTGTSHAAPAVVSISCNTLRHNGRLTDHH